jgi:HSP20 family protein
MNRKEEETMFGLIPWRKENRGEVASVSSPFEMIRREFDSLLGRYFGNWPGLFDSDGQGEAGWGLTMEDAGPECVIRAEAPGFNATDFDVRVTGDLLTIQAEHKEQGEGKDGHHRYARYARSLTLPGGVDTSKVEARYVNGVLEVRVPRTPEAQPRRIEVKA